jgi:Tfp pilus assembly PilM family ATPase
MQFFRKPKTVVGLDIGSSAVKAVELKASGKSYRVTAYGIEPVPPDAIVDGAIIDAGSVCEAIRRVFDGNKAFKTKEVCASLSGNAVIVKKITLPVMTENELSESIYWERNSTSRSTSRTSISITRSSIRAPAHTRAAAWMCCWWRRRRKRSPTTPA